MTEGDAIKSESSVGSCDGAASKTKKLDCCCCYRSPARVDYGTGNEPTFNGKFLPL
jgi:hypothetical protein